MENGLVTADGTKILTVQEYDSFLQAIPKSKRTIFEVNAITGLRYIELQRLYDNPAWITRRETRLSCLKRLNRRLSKSR
jgi:hypothetical protein